jgi:hypothetical protein
MGVEQRWLPVTVNDIEVSSISSVTAAGGVS